MSKNLKNKVRKQEVELRASIDRFLPKGQFAAMLGDADGRPLWKRPVIIDNAVATVGRAWLLKHIMSTNSSAVSTQIITAIAIGTGTNVTPSSTDTALSSEISRVAYTTETDNTTSTTGPNVVWAASWATNLGNGNISEVGLFNTTQATAGTMLAHATFSASFLKTTSNTLTVSYTFNV